MAVTDSSVLQQILGKLQTLLKKANSLRPSNSTNSTLPVAEFSGENGIPVGEAGAKVHFAAVEVASRQALQVLVGENNTGNPDFGQIWNLFDILQMLGDQEQCETVLVWYLIEELLESQSIEGCRTVFDYLESRQERLAKHFARCNLVILRSCNDLLRRLSRADDAVFCGRVFIFVFKCFPLGDKSSVNRQGDYNTDNVTTFEALPTLVQNDVDLDVMETSVDGEVEAAKSQAGKEDLPSLITTDELYPAFWGMQKSFANPPKVLQPEVFGEFKKSFDATLEKFKSMPKMLSSSSEGSRGIKRGVDDMEIDDFAADINPKYLTSRELFGLELNDLAFQRHILVQALILVEFLLSSNEAAKKKNESQAVSQKTPFNLSEQNIEWALQTKKEIVTALRDAPDGPAFARVVETVITRDKNWARWKEDNCPPISLKPVDGESFAKATKNIKSVCATRPKRSVPLTGMNLDFLSKSDVGNEVEQLAPLPTFSPPDIKTYVDRVAIAQMDLDFETNDAERENLEEKKTRSSWRALRMASRTKLDLFEKIDDGTGLERLIDKGESQITDVNENQDVEGIVDEGSGSVQSEDLAEKSEQPEDMAPQEAKSS